MPGPLPLKDSLHRAAFFVKAGLFDRRASTAGLYREGFGTCGFACPSYDSEGTNKKRQREIAPFTEDGRRSVYVAMKSSVSCTAVTVASLVVAGVVGCSGGSSGQSAQSDEEVRGRKPTASNDGGTSGSPGDGATDASGATTPTTLDLREFKTYAIEKMRTVIGPDVPLDGGQFVFVDGADAVESNWLGDRARLSYVVDLGKLSPLPEKKFCYWIGLDGTDGMEFGEFTEPKRYWWFGNGLTATLSKAAYAKPEAERKKLIGDVVAKVQKGAPHASVTALELVGVVLTSSPYPGELATIAKILTEADIFMSPLDMDATVYHVPMTFADFVDLGPIDTSKVVDLVDFTSVTKDFRQEGRVFATKPSLPKPFGPGPMPTSQK